MAKTQTVEAAVGELVALLNVEKIETYLFRGGCGTANWRRVFGGQVLGQALAAAIKTVAPERRVHSLHAYFLLPGDTKAPIVYEVEHLRDGGSFSSRRVKAIQHGRVIFITVCSFHIDETGLDFAEKRPDVPGPEALKTATELFSGAMGKLPDSMQRFWERFRALEFRPVDISRYFDRKNRNAAQQFWFKTAARLPDDPAVHFGVMAYISDFALLETALAPHGKLLSDPDVRLASLDHAIWFHRPFRADEWLLYSLDSPSSAGARGFCRGQVFSRDGKLVASTSQEGLMRTDVD
ncbi:MAG: acyl-CoA thioesterase II [Alphaproteobacteria bacterium]|nr:acyl-CoA thioesterase II [Alphaproteobacteria bacterium]